MALRPVNGRAVWARTPRSVMRTCIVPWQPASTSALVGSPSTAASPASKSGLSRQSSSRPLSARPISSRA